MELGNVSVEKSNVIIGEESTSAIEVTVEVEEAEIA